MTALRTLVMASGAVSLLLGCSAPTDGPRRNAVMAQTQQQEPQALVLVMNRSVVARLGPQPQTRFPESLRGHRASGQDEKRLDTGDRLVITVWESGRGDAGGLFVAAGQRQQNLTATVDEAGEVYVPFAGFLPARNMTVRAFRDSVVERLRAEINDPQVQVERQESQRLITVLGDVNRPGGVDITNRSMRLLDVVGAAGGARTPPGETRVRVRRGTESGEVWLASVLEHPDNNIVLAQGDIIDITHQPRHIVALGATQDRNLIPFEGRNMTLADALGRSRGINPLRADPQGVFVFRFENPERLQRAGIAIPRLAHTQDGVATVYNLNLNDPDSLFLAGQMAMQDGDILYISTSPQVDAAFFLSQILNPLSQIGSRNLP